MSLKEGQLKFGEEASSFLSLVARQKHPEDSRIDWIVRMPLNQQPLLVEVYFMEDFQNASTPSCDEAAETLSTSISVLLLAFDNINGSIAGRFSWIHSLVQRNKSYDLSPWINVTAHTSSTIAFTSGERLSALFLLNRRRQQVLVKVPGLQLTLSSARPFLLFAESETGNRKVKSVLRQSNLVFAFFMFSLFLLTLAIVAVDSFVLTETSV